MIRRKSIRVVPVTQHKRYADLLSNTATDFTQMSLELMDYDVKYAPARKQIFKLTEALKEVRSALDNIYHAGITEAEFAEHGHVYYPQRSGENNGF